MGDVYSLGCTLYYAVTGKVPFPGGKTRDKAHRHLHEHPWHPRRFNAELSEDFVETIADMMRDRVCPMLSSALELGKEKSDRPAAQRAHAVRDICSSLC